MNISETRPGYIGIGGVKRRNRTTAVIVRGTSKVRIARIPVIILASNIRLRVTARVDRSVEIFLVLSVYIWVAPIVQKPMITTIITGNERAIRNTGGSPES